MGTQIESEVWDVEAIKSLKSESRARSRWYYHYMRNLYSKSMEIGLNHVKSSMVNLLKTDLWNEGIEREKDVLGRCQNNQNLHIYGIDISKVVCFHAKPNVKKIHIVQATIENLPFTENFFNMILDLSTSDHIPENKAIDVLKEYKRVLKKGGVIVIIFRHNSFVNRWYNSFAIKHAKTRPQDNTQFYFSEKLIENAEKSFDFFEEYTIGILLIFGRLLSKLPVRLRNFVLNLTSTLEYSKLSKYILKNLGAFYVIIGAKPKEVWEDNKNGQIERRVPY